MNFTSIDHVENEEFSVVWDLGRRCTYACSYCGPHHSNKTSPMVNIDELKCTIDGIFEYSNLLNQYRTKPKNLNIAYTGGEPTIHPAFFDFVRYTKNKYPFITSNITTNGCFSQTKCKEIIECVTNATISYHTEATEKEKQIVRNNIKFMSDVGYNFRVNLMFHKDYFDECIIIADWLDEMGIKYTPRPIGDSGNKQDILDGTAHVYTKEQLSWFSNYWKKGKKTEIKSKTKNEELATKKIGRTCCNGKCLNVKIDNKFFKQTYVPSTNFQSWNCMINWDFLFINSELNGVWHHQTCQVNLDGHIGPIGKASEFENIIRNLKKKLSSGKMAVIKCPKTFCGCGLCSPKALQENDAKKIFESRTKYLEPVFQKKVKDISKDETIYGRFTEL